MNKRNLLRASFLSALMCVSLSYTSCGDDEAVPENEPQEPIDNVGNPDDDQKLPESAYVKIGEIVDYVNSSADDTVTVNVDPVGYDHLLVRLELAKISDKKVKLVIPDGVRDLGIDLGDERFRVTKDYPYPPEDNSLVSVVIPESVTKIGTRAFNSCNGLTSLNIPEGITEIGDNAFSDCSGLTSVTIPGSVKKIVHQAFSRNYSLTSITISEGVKEIGAAAFAYSLSLTSISIPEGVSSIESTAFGGCSELVSVTLPASVSRIEYSAFFGCKKLASITIPQGVTEIKPLTFAECSSLADVTIPEGVVDINKAAFSGCNSLVSITLPESVTEVGSSYTFNTSDGSDTQMYSAFIECDNLETIYCSQSLYDKYHEVLYPQMVVKK